MRSQNHWETRLREQQSGPAPDADALRAEARRQARARWRVIGIELRHRWDDILREAIPEVMLNILGRLDRQESEKVGPIESDALGG
jgi:hypothetical protein